MAHTPPHPSSRGRGAPQPRASATRTCPKRANFRFTHSTSGWSGVDGKPSNGTSLGRNQCGSSSGSVAAIAAALRQVAIGTETDGSDRLPGRCQRRRRHRPTLGLVSRTGVVPISAGQDTRRAADPVRGRRDNTWLQASDR
ncbi:amidase family protein [Amycolatopsis sp. NPDC059090]|uniref:amidase family protein n=1 Tax=Amycolatopsis sp. NPDC059090 TaxID=3346723 RepID=UPI00366BBDD0